MLQFQSKLTSQGQVSVPAAIRSLLNLSPGSMLVWREQAGQIMVVRAVRHRTEDVHQALFGPESSKPGLSKTPSELKQGIRQLTQRRHAGR
jgi:AbrB family looped-hinge helix DNA binding protein